MARITVEDCIKVVPNPFDLIMLSAHRARQLAQGAEPLVKRERDKNPVVALREISEGVVSPEVLFESLAESLISVRPVIEDGIDLIDPTVISADISEDDEDDEDRTHEEVLLAE